MTYYGLTFSLVFRNLAFSSVSTLTRYPVTSIFQNPDVEKIMVPTIRGMLLELLAVVRAIGFDEEAIPSSTVERCIESSRSYHIRKETKHKASMLVDLENGRPLELEVIIGEVVRKARELNVETPVCNLYFGIGTYT